MSVIELYPPFYCLCIQNCKGEEQMFLPSGLSPNSIQRRLDLFENEEILYDWIKEEQKMQSQMGLWGTHAVYERLYPKKISIQEFLELMKTNTSIDSVTVVDENGLRRLYFRNELEDNFDFVFINNQKLFAKEPIYIINRQKKIDEKTIIQKQSYFVTYPEIATPLFSVGIREWADELISRKADQGYYIEQTTLYDVYNRTNLNSKDLSLFILAREEAPHYILRQKNLRTIIDSQW